MTPDDEEHLQRLYAESNLGVRASKWLKLAELWFADTPLGFTDMLALSQPEDGSLMGVCRSGVHLGDITGRVRVEVHAWFVPYGLTHAIDRPDSAGTYAIELFDLARSSQLRAEWRDRAERDRVLAVLDPAWREVAG